MWLRLSPIKSDIISRNTTLCHCQPTALTPDTKPLETEVHLNNVHKNLVPTSQKTCTSPIRKPTGTVICGEIRSTL
jgi:hypothetical protein